MEEASRVRVRDLMSLDPIAVESGDDLAAAHELMQEHHVRHLPVVDRKGRIVGLVSHRDLLRHSLFAQPDEPDFLTTLRSVTIGEVMVARVATVTPDADIRQAAQVMLDHQYGCLPVVEGQQLVGILTESDFVRLMAEGD